MLRTVAHRIALSSLGLLLLLSACAAPTLERQASDSLPEPPLESVDQASAGAVVVEAVEVQVLESEPPQLQLTISGYLPDGCEVPIDSHQTREGQTVRVTLKRELPPDTVCTAVIRPYEQELLLEGNFEPGVYQIQVNDFTVEQAL